MGFWTTVAPFAGSIVTGLLGLDAQTSAAETAAEAQLTSTREQIAEARRQFDAQMAEYREQIARSEQLQDQQIRQLSPYIQGGQSALYEMMALTGLEAPEVTNYTPSQIASAYQNRFADTTTGTTSIQEPITTESGTYGPDILAQYYAPTGSTATSRSNRILSSGTGEWTQGEDGRWYRQDIGGQGTRYGYDVVDSGLYGGPATEGVGSPGLFSGIISDAIQSAVSDATAGIREDTSLIEQRYVPTVESQYAGMSGEDAQAAAIEKISSSPLLAELTSQGEEAILQQAAATGGLRGGNVQGALAQYRPQMLQNAIDSQYSKLQGLSNLGQQSILGSATGTTSTSYPSSSNLESYLGDIGSINASEALASGSATSDFWSGLSELFGQMYGSSSSSDDDDLWDNINWETVSDTPS
jgi:hypothetical protein